MGETVAFVLGDGGVLGAVEGLVPAAEVPRSGPEEQVEWLYGWWEQIDDWIAEHHPAG